MAIRQKRVRLVGKGPHVRLSRFGPWDKDPIADVRDACRVDMAVEKFLYQSVQTARDAGHSWSDIGKAMGVSRKDVEKRFAHGFLGRGW